jgi:DNA invertase Pin-like site-specific DNA recombinase
VHSRCGKRGVHSGHITAFRNVAEDAGISGAKGRRDRPALDALLKCVARREVDMVAAWSVDRLGRSLTDLLDFLRELHAKGVDLFLHQQGLDTSTPSGRAMFQMMGVFAEFERAMIRERGARWASASERARDQPWPAAAGKR